MHKKLSNTVEEEAQVGCLWKKDMYSLLNMLKITCYFNDVCTEEYMFILF